MRIFTACIQCSFLTISSFTEEKPNYDEHVLVRKEKEEEQEEHPLAGKQSGGERVEVKRGKSNGSIFDM